MIKFLPKRHPVGMSLYSKGSFARTGSKENDKVVHIMDPRCLNLALPNRGDDGDL